MEYELIRSDRRSFAAEIKNGKLLIRAPLYAREKEIENFIDGHEKWIEAHLERSRENTLRGEKRRLSDGEIDTLYQKAKEILPVRVAYYAEKIGVTYGKITIRRQKTRWGSCSSKGNLSFNCLLMLAPIEVIDSVIVHELCHRKQMNHSDKFYGEIIGVFPDYRKYHKWLKENGERLMAMSE